MLSEAAIGVRLNSKYRRARPLGVLTFQIEWLAETLLVNGTGGNQADLLFASRRSIAAGANDDLNLASGLVDPFNNAVVFSEVRAVTFRTPSSNSGLVRVGGSAPANRLTGLFVDATGYLDVAPGMTVAIIAPADNDVVVVNGASNILRLNNQGAAINAIDVAVFGTSV